MYGIVLRQYGLSLEEKAIIFIHILDGPERTLYMKNPPEDGIYDSIVKVMVKEYNRDALQTQVREKLELFRLRSFMAEMEI